MPDSPLPTRDTQFRFLRFVVVGGSSYAVQWLTMKLFLAWFVVGAAFNLSFICSTATHYTLNRFWALPSTRRDPWRQFFEYLATAVLSWGINKGMFLLCHDVLGLGPLWSTAISVPPSTIVVFLILHLRVFRKAHLDEL